MVYQASPTLSRFHRSKLFYRGIVGPVGSGKSTACCMEIMSRALRQAPGPDGIRHTRWVVVRNTYGELKDTTLVTWLMWFGESIFGPFAKSEMTHRIEFKDVSMEVMFRALDRPDHVAKLKSMELTGAWVNETAEIPKGIVDMLGDRVGRFPPVRDGGCTWRGVMMDTNAPDEDHWWYELAENQAGKLKNWQFFRQPGGLLEKDGKFSENPLAENMAYLEPHYYLTRVEGKSLAHIRVFYCAKYGFAVDGKPVIPEYSDILHCAQEPLKPVGGIPIRIGLDFGLTPAASFGQRLPNGRWIWFHELPTEDMGIKRYAALLIREIQEKFPGFEFETIWGDPAGEQRAQTDESTPFEIINAEFQRAGLALKARPAPTNDATLRRESLGNVLSRIIDGKPGLMISPTMKIMRKGLNGGYCFKRMKVLGDERFYDVPDKNKYSHIVESGEYMLVGAGEGVELVTAPRREKKPEIYMGGMVSAQSWMG